MGQGLGLDSDKVHFPFMILSLKDNDISCVLKERDGRRFMVFEAKKEPSVLMVDEAVENLLFN